MNRGYQNLKELEAATVAAVHALEAAIANEGTISNHNLATAISGEQQARNKLADAQRAYVDEEDRKLRQHFSTFIGRGFWSRLNWLITGR